MTMQPSWAALAKKAASVLAIPALVATAVVLALVVVPVGSLVVNLGESAKGKLTTRMGVAALVRKAFADADAYRTSKPATKNANMMMAVVLMSCFWA
jgi:hypothetical protein